MYSSAVFVGGSTLCTQILLGQGCPLSAIFGIRNLDTGLPDSEDCILLRFLFLTQHRSMMDRRIAYTAIAKLVLRHTVNNTCEHDCVCIGDAGTVLLLRMLYSFFILLPTKVCACFSLETSVIKVKLTECPEWSHFVVNHFVQ